MVNKCAATKMKKLIFALSTLSLLTFYSCSKWAGDPITQKFSIDGNYTELQVYDAFDVIVSDTVSQIIITAGENVMPYVVVKNSDNRLEIYLKGWHSNRGKDMTVILPYNANLKCVDLSGASDFHSQYGISGDKVEVDLSGASDFYCDIIADEIDMDLSGSSNVNGYLSANELDLDMSGASNANIEGQVATFKIDLSGSSTIKKVVVGNRYALVCNQCEGSLSGSSDAYIHCDGSIRVSLSGSSDLYYTGNASTSGSSTSGSSDLVHDVL